MAGSSCVIDTVLDAVDAGKNGVVLLHDIHRLTAEALPTLIKRLKERGKHFVTVEDLVRERYGRGSRSLTWRYRNTH